MVAHDGTASPILLLSAGQDGLYGLGGLSGGISHRGPSRHKVMMSIGTSEDSGVCDWQQLRTYGCSASYHWLDFMHIT